MRWNRVACLRSGLSTDAEIKWVRERVAAKAPLLLSLSVLLLRFVPVASGFVSRPCVRCLQGAENGLVNNGSRAASLAGLYQHATQIAQGKELGSMADIGFHYVALDGSGNPYDADSDGFPDYFEDTNGNGSVDTGETNWQSYDSPNGLTGNPGLQVFTPLKP